MGSTSYERLSRLDEGFLEFETATTPMHVALVGTFERAPLATKEGGVDIERIRHWVASRLPAIPRYTQRLHTVPVFGDRVWVPDERFELHYHVRHARLPRPGTAQQLKNRCAEILERPLDRARPLWELWIVEGVGEDRFAMVAKVHHCMVDGLGGVEILALLLGLEPFSGEIADVTAVARSPRAPENGDLLREEVARRTRSLLGLGRDIGRALAEPRSLGRRVGESLTATAALASGGLRRPPATPFNQPVGHHRRVDWVTVDLARTKTLARSLGVSLNDLVLALLATSLRRFLQERGQLTGFDELRIAVPVNVRTAETKRHIGNHASAWLLALPLDEPDVVRCALRIHDETAALKRAGAAKGIELLTDAAEWATSGAMRVAVRLISRARPYNLIVTNVPGPGVPLYLLGSRLLEAHPHLPLFEGQGLAVALFSYEDRLSFGLNGDWDLLPDLDRLVSAITASFAALVARVGGGLEAENERPEANGGSTAVGEPAAAEPRRASSRRSRDDAPPRENAPDP